MKERESVRAKIRIARAGIHEKNIESVHCREEGVYFPIHPDSRQCTDILSSLSGNY